MLSYLPQRTALKTINSMATHMTSRPITPRKFHSPPSRINYFHLIGGEGELNLLHMEEGLFRKKLRAHSFGL